VMRLRAGRRPARACWSTTRTTRRGGRAGRHGHADAGGAAAGGRHAPGDRRDEDLREVGRLCATFDHVIIKEDEYRRGARAGRHRGAAARRAARGRLADGAARRSTTRRRGGRADVPAAHRHAGWCWRPPPAPPSPARDSIVDSRTPRRSPDRREPQVDRYPVSSRLVRALALSDGCESALLTPDPPRPGSSRAT
jgi:hypothetical protein